MNQKPKALFVQFLNATMTPPVFPFFRAMQCSAVQYNRQQKSILKIAFEINFATSLNRAQLAQSGECLLSMLKVPGSNPGEGNFFWTICYLCCLCCINSSKICIFSPIRMYSSVVAFWIHNQTFLWSQVRIPVTAELYLCLKSLLHWLVT